MPMNTYDKVFGKKKHYKASHKGMKKGYHKIVDEQGTTIRSGITSKQAALEIARRMNYYESRKRRDIITFRR